MDPFIVPFYLRPDVVFEYGFCQACWSQGLVGNMCKKCGATDPQKNSGLPPMHGWPDHDKVMAAWAKRVGGPGRVTADPVPTTRDQSTQTNDAW